jgi:hypothetical protein
MIVFLRFLFRDTHRTGGALSVLSLLCMRGLEVYKGCGLTLESEGVRGVGREGGCKNQLAVCIGICTGYAIILSVSV